MHRPHDADIVVFGDRDALSQAADRIGLPVSFADADAAEVPAGTIRIIHLPNAAPATPGTPDPRNAVAVIAALAGAAAACITGTDERRGGPGCGMRCRHRRGQ